MRVFLILCWLAIPFFAWAFHVGPGQEQLKLDKAGTLLTQARYATRQQDFGQAKLLYEQALAEIPNERSQDQYAVRLALAKTQLEADQLPEARVALDALLSEVEGDKEATPALVADVRTTLANAQYYMTWLMRLEGLPAEEWEPEIEASRQHFRLLAEQAQSAGNTDTLETRQNDLEAAIQLARLDLSDLQALKLPSQCKNCCSGQCQKPSRKQAKRQGQEKPGGGANLGPLPDGSGS